MMAGEDSAQTPRVGLPLVPLALAILALSASEIFRLYVSASDTNLISQCAFVALGLAFIPHFTLREWVMTLFAVLLTFGNWLADEHGAILHALSRAAFFGAFIYLVTLLKEAAERSRSVLELGSFMTRQPPSRRYYSLSIGGHFMGVLLNFGAISLLAPLIQRGAKAAAPNNNGDGPSKAQLEQQQISALLRGFSWMIMWSPTALTQAVLLTSFPDAKATLVIPLGIGASMLMILIGRVFDRLYWRNLAPQASLDPPIFPQTAAWRFGGICFGLIIVTFVVVFLADVTAAIALMLVAPVVMATWIFAQHVVGRPGKAAKLTGQSYFEIFVRRVQHSAQSAYVLGLAGFIGVSAASLAPVNMLATHLAMSSIPEWIFLATLPVLITLGGQLALSPIMVVVFIAAILNELPTLPADPSHVVFALGAGWALSMTVSPNASATLLISAITRIPSTTLTWRWNGAYGFVCYLAFVFCFAILSL